MNYHPLMIRLLTGLLAVVAMTAAGTAATASAEPPCSFTLSPPHLTQVSGTDAVAVTVSPGACNQAESYILVACIQQQGSPGPGLCRQNNGILTAQVYWQPYRPGATYIATGRGCASAGNPKQPYCQPVGPITATL